MGASDALGLLLGIVLVLSVLAWPFCLVAAARRGQWIWFVAMICVWFLAPFYFFQIASDRKVDLKKRELDKVQRRRKRARSERQSEEMADLKREVQHLKEKLG
jgi:hypothetical protein